MVGMRAKDHEDKRRLILDRSAELFARQGFHRTSISEIALACNASSKAWIYHYFPNKEAVLFTLLRDFLELAGTRVREAIALRDGARDRLHAFVLECLRIYAEYRINYAVLFSDINLLPPDQRAEIRVLERAYAHVLRDLVLAVNPGIDRGRHQTMALTMIAFGAVNWTYTWFDADGPLSLDNVAELTTKLLLNGLESI
ncbi:TetR/AcrR family transcriptional regulator [Roseateles toxinivorans]|uniref:TetR family transcriptional regulator n=1 Tax=Roseateles toxinivorans TaxID=270368 RepID=A0A4R6QCS0_9BURK|nr:TetR/AcrR family transcriptional regulator [Roseateles toxinivorans]TDP60438.1 TetR family transcriptional regulator [Roseateles toxinivorans]